MPRNRASVHQRQGTNCAVVSSYSNDWPAAFPQHGPGRKHDRDISLEIWQRRLTERHPEAFLRGLIHSDGSRFVAIQRVGERVYRYARYSFSNRSEQIKLLFCQHLDLLGIRWTRPNEKHIEVARKADVGALDRFVGPKE